MRVGKGIVFLGLFGMFGYVVADAGVDESRLLITLLFGFFSLIAVSTSK